MRPALKCFAGVILLSLIAAGIDSSLCRAQEEKPDRALIVKAVVGGAGLLEKWAKKLESENADISVVVIGSTEEKAFDALLNGEASLSLLVGRVTKDQQALATEKGLGLVGKLVGRTGFAIITQPRNSLSALTLEQVRNLFTGTYKRWSEVGGPDEPAKVFLKRPGISPVSKLFRQDLLLWAPYTSDAVIVNSFMSVIRRCAHSKELAIGFVPISLLMSTEARREVKVLALKRTDNSEAVLPSENTISDFSYPAAGIPLYLYWDKKAQDQRVKRFAHYCVLQGGATAGAFATVTKNDSFAAAKKREKHDVDKRAVESKGKKWSTSEKEFRWRMSDPWGGLLFHDVSIHFADSVRAASGGRLNIKVFQTGAIVPAMEIFDSVSKGTLECAHSWPGYWKGRNEAFVAFASVPFGLDNEGYNIWYYERGGKEMLDELYGKYGIKSFFCGNVGQELGMHSNKKATKMEDFKGMKIRTPGWYMDILNLIGASVTPLPGSEIYLALERGVIDACEFSSPAVNLPMGFQDITKYIIEPGVHQPSCQFDVFFNKKKFDSLPEDLKAIVEICAKETQLWTNAWQENLNIKAVEEIGKKSEYVMMDDSTIIEFAKTTKKYLDGLKAKYPDVKKVLDSQELFKKEFAHWRKLRGRMVPWPYEDIVKGQLTQ